MPHTILKVEQFDFSHFSRECGNFIFDATSISCNLNKVRVVLNLFCYRAKPNCKVRVCNCNSKLVQLEKWVAPFKKLRPESVSKRILRMRANGTRMPLNGVQMHQKVSRRFQKFPEVSECIRITVVSAPNWPKIGRSVSKNKPPPISLWELLTINAIYVRERLPCPLILSYTLHHLSPNACIATNIF